jgi:hypothetical protein
MKGLGGLERPGSYGPAKYRSCMFPTQDLPTPRKQDDVCFFELSNA